MGPELLLRTRYGVAVRVDDLPAFYNRWERWAADVAESHSNYPVLVRFRSPHPLDSWLVGLLSVMDSAAMLLALRPSQDRIEPRRAIRMGFTALREIGGALGMAVDMDPDPDSDITLTFEEFAAAVDQLRTVGFPVEREAEEAWPHFRGWRVNYEALAYALAYQTDQVPAPWSGPVAGARRPYQCSVLTSGRPARRPSETRAPTAQNTRVPRPKDQVSPVRLTTTKTARLASTGRVGRLSSPAAGARAVWHNVELCPAPEAPPQAPHLRFTGPQARRWA